MAAMAAERRLRDNVWCGVHGDGSADNNTNDDDRVADAPQKRAISKEKKQESNSLGGRQAMRGTVLLDASAPRVVTGGGNNATAATGGHVGGRGGDGVPSAYTSAAVRADTAVGMKTIERVSGAMPVDPGRKRTHVPSVGVIVLDQDVDNLRNKRLRCDTNTNDWPCGMCTFVNSGVDGSRACAVCGTARDLSNGDRLWSCAHCSAANASQSLTCCVCENVR
eukprot:Opistho-2@85434